MNSPAEALGRPTQAPTRVQSRSSRRILLFGTAVTLLVLVLFPVVWVHTVGAPILDGPNCEPKDGSLGRRSVLTSPAAWRITSASANETPGSAL